jgi:hypothetical protein
LSSSQTGFSKGVMHKRSMIAPTPMLCKTQGYLSLKSILALGWAQNPRRDSILQLYVFALVVDDEVLVRAYS